VRERALVLGSVFGDRQALASLRTIATDTTATAEARHHALQALLQQRSPDLVHLLQALLNDRVVRRAALRGLAAYSHEDTPKLILRLYASFAEDEKSDATQTLAARPAYALALLEGVEKGQIPRRDLSAFTVRQMLALKNAPVSERLTKVWGTIRPASQEKAALTGKYKALLTPQFMQDADRSHGRAVFVRTCAACHQLFGEGGAIGPELTGSQRANLDYLLENILDPSAVVYSEYQVTLVATKDGRVVTGIIKEENAKAITLQTQNDRVVIPKNEIETRTRSPLSLMPEGLLENLKNEEVRDLIAYLASPTQVPLPKK
jgi:putative heme-binding domain-containing protein